MKQRDVTTLIIIAVFTAIFSFAIGSVAFKSPSNRSVKVPDVENVSGSFPDLKNDPNYSSIFNQNALDPAQPLQVGNTQNNQPFNGAP